MLFTSSRLNQDRNFWRARRVCSSQKILPKYSHSLIYIPHTESSVISAFDRLKKVRKRERKREKEKEKERERERAKI